MIPFAGLALALTALTTLPSQAPSSGATTAPPTELPVGRIVEKVACRSNPAFTYALYLPTDYTPARRRPVLLVFDPGARAVLGAELFREPAERFGWIVMSSGDTHSSGSTMRHNADAAVAMLGDADTRWATDRRRYYAAGFSGGATLAWVVGREPGLLAGVIGCGGPWQDGVLPECATYDHFGAVGTLDFNFTGMARVDRVLGERGAAHRLARFPGRHAWMPAALAAEAVAWLEVQAMRRGLRERDSALVGSLLAADDEAARALDAAGDPLAAMRRWEAITATYDDLADIGPARAEAARLAASPAVAAAHAEETRWRSFEDAYLASAWSALASLLREETPPTPVLVSELKLAELERMSARAGVEAEVGRRLLESLWSQLTMVVAPQLVARRDYARLVPALTLADRIRPGAPLTLYNLACAHARAGSKRAALDALGRAVDGGFRDRALVESDPDLAALRGRKEYAEILARLAAAPAAAPTPVPLVP
jgi:predicted esterase